MATAADTFPRLGNAPSAVDGPSVALARCPATVTGPLFSPKNEVVGDFSGWDSDAAKYEAAVEKLLIGLNAREDPEK